MSDPPILPQPPKTGIVQAQAPEARIEARVSVTVHRTTIGVRASTYWQARCPACRHLLFYVAGTRAPDVRIVSDPSEYSGMGAVVKCERCKRLVDVVAA